MVPSSGRLASPAPPNGIVKTKPCMSSITFLLSTHSSVIYTNDPSTTTPPTLTGGEVGNYDHPRGGWGCPGL